MSAYVYFERTRTRVHSIRIHGFAQVEVKILEIWGDLGGVVVLDFLLEIFNLCLIRAAFLQFFHNLLQVACASRSGRLHLLMEMSRISID